MNLATRILGVVIFVSLLAGATYAAFQGFGDEPEVGSIELHRPAQTPDLLAGQQTPIVLGAENGGDADAELEIVAETEGFTFETNPAVTTITARNSTQLNGVLTADADLEGEHNITVAAYENGTDDRLTSVAFDVAVTAPTPPELSLDAVLPAVLPGGQATFDAQLENTVNAPQTINLTVAGGEGSAQPQQVSLQPNGSGSATVTSPVPEAASGAHEITLEAINEAGQTVTASDSVSIVPDGEIAIEALQSSFTVDAGNRYTVPIVVVSNADAGGNITATGEDIVATNFTSIEARESAGGFVTLSVPEDASQPLEPTIEIAIGDRTETLTVSVSPSPSGETPGQGQQAELEYTGRLLNGSIFATSVPGIGQGPFPKSTHFQEGGQAQTMTVRIGASQQQAPPGVVSAVENMTEDESRTVTLQPEDAFGPERETQEMEATTELNRHEQVPRLIEDAPKQQLPGEFDIDNREEGEVIEFETQAGDETIVLRFRVLEITQDTVSLERVAEEGETITFYSPWPNATEVTSLNETTIVYTTTPPDEASEESFAWDAVPDSHEAEWGQTTTVETVNDTAILLRHQPEEGIEYTAASGRFGQERSFRVEDVTQETITVSTPNQNPLGGEMVTFDLTLVDISEAQQRRLPPGLGGG